MTFHAAILPVVQGLGYDIHAAVPPVVRTGHDGQSVAIDQRTREGIIS